MNTSTAVSFRPMFISDYPAHQGKHASFSDWNLADVDIYQDSYIRAFSRFGKFEKIISMSVYYCRK